ncbi:hemerythrin domain-containing protein [Microbulbifer marinus]|uniref:Hemerythrin HHE cation binding domain-containing protein n=1 Tax=Microbulbifer marinus TaxID=658218 RepID=A0A1H3WYB7_9GAMM|nr:hemerythrin domain-containing protein [Microbulbifer marinus]SDZ92103.1 Hemerythrin HHE cation binding domain-containing protein [Microbulbifer marinus]
MIRFISGMFGSDSTVDEEKYTRSGYSGTNAGRTISYDPSLINALKKDHYTLIDIFQRIWSEGYEKQDFRQLSQLLTQFKSGFQAHLIKENVRFYVYLEQALAGDAHTLQIVKDFRTDMNEIANAVVQFCKRYTHEAFTQEMNRDFKRDYQKIGEALTRRVTLEENELYTLYQPS